VLPSTRDRGADPTGSGGMSDLADPIVADLINTLRTLPKGWHAPMFSMREVVDHGRPYVGTSRPRGYRKRAAKRQAAFFRAGHR